MGEITYAVRVYAIEKRKNERGAIVSHRVRWKAGGEVFREQFTVAAQADAYRSRLMTAASHGEAFSTRTGLPLSWEREETALSWFSFTLEYAAIKWPYASPNHRRGIAEALVDATEALIAKSPPHAEAARRDALRWAYSGRLRDGDEQPPAEHRHVLAWLDANTPSMDAFGNDAAPARSILERISSTKEGKRAAANTYNRKRAVLSNLFGYARERGFVEGNPFESVTWSRPRTLTTVDPRTVLNADQARRFLAAVRKHGERGRRMEAFFGCMYYAGLRPEEAVDLRRENISRIPERSGAWGEFRLTNSEPRSGTRWTDSGKPRERRELKHRAPGDTRTVPMHPDLVALLRRHLDDFGTGPGGRVFIGPRGGLMTDRAYLKVFHEARAKALTQDEAASPLATRPYDLRHAALSTWLSNGVPVPQVAQWAGNSPQVLLRVYAKCISGQEQSALDRIWEATREASPDHEEDQRESITEDPDNESP